MNKEKNTPYFIEISGNIINIDSIKFIGKTDPEQHGYDLIIIGRAEPITIYDSDYKKLVEHLKPLIHELN